MSALEPPASSDTTAGASEIVRRLLRMIDDGEIDAGSPKAKALQRRLEGALAAWEASRLASAPE